MIENIDPITAAITAALLFAGGLFLEWREIKQLNKKESK